MSINLIVEVLEHAPETLTSGERLVLVVIAEWANDTTRLARQTHNWTLDTVCRRAGIKRSGLKSILQGLAKKGLEVRVPVKLKDGKPIYAYEGTAVTFCMPDLRERGGQGIPTDDARGDATASERGGHSIREGMPQPPPSPQGSPLKKNPSSLSPSADEADASPIPAQPTEREIEGASQQPNNHNPVDVLLLDAGCPQHHLDDVREELTRRFEPKSNAWWRTVAKSGDLPALVGDVLEALQPMTPALTAEHHADAHPFQPKSDGSPDCQHCPFPAANGRHKVGNQGGGYVSPRVNLVNANSRRSTSVVRAEQALRVGAQLDAEANGAWIGPSRYHHLTDSRHPGRDYREPL